MEKNKNVKEIETYSVTFAINNNGVAIALSKERIKKMVTILNKELHYGEKLSIWEWKEDSTVFQRANRPKRFSPAEAIAIKNSPGSIRQKAARYNASTKTIQSIKNGTYY